MKQNEVIVTKISDYNVNDIYGNLPNEVFSTIKPSDKVVIKPNWVRHSHLNREGDWDYVITHPSIITAVILKVLNYLGENGKIIICDSPSTDTDFQKLISYYPIKLWMSKAKEKNVTIQIIDLRDNIFKMKDGLVIERRKILGDPRGSVEVNLKGEKSEFIHHKKSERGYYGADFNLIETNQAHNGFDNKYRVSRTVIEADLFINIPKLKTHKKGGITCCLKNLVGINTYKNFLPHHTEGSPMNHGDQFPKENINSRIEGPILALLKQHMLQNTIVANVFIPLKKIARTVFGDTEKVIRSGNWHGNDTLWRMVLDLNKVLYYANSDGTMKESNKINAKRYIGVVDGIIGGEGNGPLNPEPINSGFLIVGTNPVAIDSASAKLIGFNPENIPSIKRSFEINNYKICDFKLQDIIIFYKGSKYMLNNFPKDEIVKYKPHFGWIGHIEKI